jgi:hypothetical protein
MGGSECVTGGQRHKWGRTLIVPLHRQQPPPLTASDCCPQALREARQLHLHATTGRLAALSLSPTAAPNSTRPTCSG